MTAPHWQPSCPISIDPLDDRVTLAHGEGARLTRRLIAEHIVPRFGNPALNLLGDAAFVEMLGNRLAVTTDSFVVSPLFFPGGDIGSLAVFGTVNDLAVSGASPVCLTLSLILEEGLPLKVLDCVLDSVAAAARRCGVPIVAGDTKVVPRGSADALFISTTGIGVLAEPVPPGPQAIQPGDAVIASGPVGQHGIAVMAARERLQFDPPPSSDSAPLHELTAALQKHLGTGLRAMRDATRGGVSAVLHEWSIASGLTLHIDEAAVPVTAEIRAACELLGLEPLYVASEGTMLVAVEPALVEAALSILRGRSL
jgi:hydrogenase expression/formation protein HypE